MTREHSWRFLEIGRRLERGMQILNLLSGIDFCANNGFNASLETLLETSDSRMTYRARYMAVPTVPLVFDLLVCDDGNPRALIYQILKLRQNISVLEKESRLPGLFSKELLILEDIVGGSGNGRYESGRPGPDIKRNCRRQSGFQRFVKRSAFQIAGIFRHADPVLLCSRGADAAGAGL